MKIIKIGALWCGACLITNKAWNLLKKNYDFESEELDIDMNEEEVQNYSIGDVLPVFLFFEGEKEVKRLVGEISYEELEQAVLEVGDYHEES